MIQALVFGALGSSALVLGALLGSVWEASTKVTGIMLAFASGGTLISALSFELFPEGVEMGGLWSAAAGLLAGGATFVVVNTWIDSRVAEGAGDPEDVAATGELADELSGAEAEQREKLQDAARPDGPNGVGLGIALALLAAVTLDGVPENLALGVSLLSSESGAPA